MLPSTKAPANRDPMRDKEEVNLTGSQEHMVTGKFLLTATSTHDCTLS